MNTYQLTIYKDDYSDTIYDDTVKATSIEESARIHNVIVLSAMCPTIAWPKNQIKSLYNNGFMRLNGFLILVTKQ